MHSATNSTSALEGFSLPPVQTARITAGADREGFRDQERVKVLAGININTLRSTDLGTRS